MVRPTGTSLPNIIGAEARRKVSAGYRTPILFSEPAHNANASTHQSPNLARMAYRSAA
jgi:hypothetical protein